MAGAPALKCLTVRPAVVGTGGRRRGPGEGRSTRTIDVMSAGTEDIMRAIAIDTKEIDAGLVRVLAVAPATAAVVREAHRVLVLAVVLVPDHARAPTLRDAAALAAATESRNRGPAAGRRRPRRTDLPPRTRVKSLPPLL